MSDLAKSVSPSSGAPSSRGSTAAKAIIGIGKRKVESDGEDTAADAAAEERERRHAHTKRVRADLSAFLSSKGVDTSRHMANITIELKVRSEPFNPRKKGPGNAGMAQGERYQAHFRLADGAVYSQKADVYAALLKLPAAKGGGGVSGGGAAAVKAPGGLKVATSPTAKNAAAITPVGTSGGTGAGTPTSNTVTMRKEAHEAAMAAVGALVGSLPCAVGGDGLQLYGLGNLDPRPTFHSATQLYTQGYRAEITVADTEKNRAFVGITAGRSTVTLPATFLCFIKSGPKGAPLFKMTNMATTVSHEMETEEAVFRQHFPGIDKAGTGVSSGADGTGDSLCGGVTGAATGGLGPWTSVAPFSFFNFEVEKLMEGLKGALLCHSYKMHCQRGYPTKYSDAASAAIAKRSLVITRYNAVKNASADSTASGSAASKAAALKAEKAAAAAAAAAEASISTAFKKQQSGGSAKYAMSTQQDKEARSREREASSLEKAEQKLREKQQRELAKAQKEEEKKEEAKIRAAAQQRKMQEALDNKYRNAYRADVKKNVVKAQRDASAAVLDAFDAEECESSISALIAQLCGQTEEEQQGGSSAAVAEVQVQAQAEEEEEEEEKKGGCQEQLPEALARVAQPCADVLLSDLANTLLEPCSDSDSGGASATSSAFVSSALSADIWDPLLRASNTLTLHRDFLNLQIQPSVEVLARGLVTLASQREVHARALVDGWQNSAGKKKKVKEEAAAVATKEAMDVVKTENPEDATASEQSGGGGGDGVEEEAEASLEDLTPTPAPAEAEAEANEPADLAAALRGQANADLDRVLLCLTQAICSPLHTLLNLDDEHVQTSYRNDVASTHAVRLPLNELTCAEVARMSLLAHVMPCMSFTADETRAVLRGSSAAGSAGSRSSGMLAGYRNARNVMRHLRYRILARNARLYDNDKDSDIDSKSVLTAVGEDRLLFLRQHVKLNQNDTRKLSRARPLQTGAGREAAPSTSQMPESDFLDADDFSRLVASLQAAGAPDSGLPEVYQRCARVLLKVSTSACGKHLLWDTSFREYLQVIRYPMTLSVVATRLLKTAYGTGRDELEVATACYADMRLAAINAIVYHTEAIVSNALTHKALHVMHRYAYEWLFSEQRPALEQCADGVCMLSGRELASAAVTLKCGRCSAPCSLDALHEASVDSSSKILSRVSRHACLMAPSQELVDRSHEEWVCPLCVEEDSVDINVHATDTSVTKSGKHTSAATAAAATAAAAAAENSFWVDEFGPSSSLPWHLNAQYSRALERAAENFPVLHGLLWDTICVLTSPCRTSFNATVTDADTLEGEAIVLGLPSASTALADSQGTTAAEAQRKLVQADQPWTSNDRVKLILCLAELLKGSDSKANPVGSEAYAEIYEKNSSLNDLCGKLVRLSTQSSPFKEAEFMRVVRDVAGEEGVLLARESLDRINSERVNASTDLRELMTGAGLASENSSTTFSDTAVIDKFRDRDAEDTLLNRSIDLKAIEDPSSKNKEKLPARLNPELLASEKVWAEHKCQYCGLSELEMCSPFVIGHSPLDHAYHQSRHGDKAGMYASGTLSATDGSAEPYQMDYTRVYMRSGLDDFKAPALTLPYWPTLDSPNGQSMLRAMGAAPLARTLVPIVDLTKERDRRTAEGIPDVQPTIVHQLCALQMFKARLERRNHELRRKRRVLAQRIIGLSGLYTVCLGKDAEGNEYWKFPTAVSPALFVCKGVPEDPMQQQFCASQLDKGKGKWNTEEVSGAASGEAYGWSMVTDRAGVQGVLSAVQWSLQGSLEHKVRERLEGLAEELELLLKNKIAFPEPKTAPPLEVISLGTDSEAAAAAGAAAVKVESADAAEMEVVVIDDSEATSEKAAVVSETKEGGMADGKEEPIVKVREKREGLNSWLVKSSGSAAGAATDHSQISHLHAIKKGAHGESTPSFDQFAFVDPATMVLPESQPVELRYLPQKGQTVLPVYIIDQQYAFDEKRSLQPSGDYYEDDDQAEEMEDTSFEEYFTFNSRQRKFIVLSMFNNQDRKVRVPKGSVNLRFEVYRDARAEPLVTIDLTEMWSDGLYYFSMPNFKRAGKYKLMFTAETIPEYATVGKPAVDLRFIKPVTFDVSVEARRTLFGAADAIAKLNAHTYTPKAGRRSVIDKIRFSSYEYMQALRSSCDDGSITECNANKLAILTVFSALPCGCLTLATEAEEVQSGVAHASGWGDELEEAWFNGLVRAKTPLELMECILLLEFYVNKAWLATPMNRLFNALPAPQFALRCVTFSAVALRVFSLDRCLAYSTVQKEPRAPRLSKAALNASKAAAAGFDVAAGAPRSSGREKSKVTYAEENDSFDNASSEDDNDEDDVNQRGRSRRAAASAATSRIKNLSEGREQISDDEDGNDGSGPTGGSTRRRGGSRGRALQAVEEDEGDVSNAPADSWVCGTCTCQNSLRARSCEACGEKRSAATAAQPVKVRGDGGRGGRKRKAKFDDEEEEEEEEEEEDEEQVGDDLDWPQLMADCGVVEEVDADSRADVAGRQLSLLRSLHTDMRSSIFWVPVPLDTPGYHDLITNPMDLGTITDKVVAGSYYVDDGQSTTAGLATNAHAAFCADVALVWSNCRLYNAADKSKTGLYALAAQLDQGFRARYARWVTNSGMSGARPENPDITE